MSVEPARRRGRSSFRILLAFRGTPHRIVGNGAFWRVLRASLTKSGILMSKEACSFRLSDFCRQMILGCAARSRLLNATLWPTALYVVTTPAPAAMVCLGVRVHSSLAASGLQTISCFWAVVTMRVDCYQRNTTRAPSGSFAIFHKPSPTSLLSTRLTT
jgi:hypothetical protein